MSTVINFRDLTPDDVEVRVAMARKNGVSLLIYKDARVDQAILDETVGQMNWRKSYQMIKDNLYCSIDLWDEEKKQWVSKQDCGVESNTEKEKGEASDAQKRAGFVWGIGRELYSAPFIWVSEKDCKIEEKSKGVYACKDRFSVSVMTVENKKIVDLQIVNESTNKTVFVFGSSKAQPTKREAEPVKSQTKKTETPVVRPVAAKPAPAAKEIMSLEDALNYQLPSKNGDKLISLRSMVSKCTTSDAEKKLLDYLRSEVKKKSDASEPCLVVFKAIQKREINLA